MKNRLLIIGLLVFVSCDTTEDWFVEEVNDQPRISFTFLDNDIENVVDSIKYSNRIRESYFVNVTVKDPEFNIDFVYFDLISGQGDVVSGGNYTNAFIDPEDEVQGKYSFEFRANGLGIHEILIIAQDTFGESDSVSVKLTAFDNLAPVAKLDAKLVGILSRLEYVLDASNSYDRDSGFGGEIVEYEYSINSQVIIRGKEEERLTHIFSEEGVAVLSLRVKDNDGIWSERFETIRNIN